MRKQQHTPGPWHISTSTYGDSSDSSDLATIYGVTRQATEDGLGRGWVYITASKPCFEIEAEERLANARLMATAPKMLEALEMAVAGIEWYIDTYQHGVKDETDDEFLSQAKMVIAEIEGEN